MMTSLRSLAAILLLLGTFSGCSLPKIVFLHDPLSADEHTQLGIAYDSQQKHDLALDQFRLAIKKDKKHLAAWKLLADLSYRLNDLDSAVSALEKAIELEPASGDSRNNLAWVYLKQGTNLKQAATILEEALMLHPANRPYYLDTLGMVLLKLGKTKEAVSALEESARTLPADKPEVLAEAYDHLAQAYDAAGNKDGHERSLIKAQVLRNKK
ncbi:MAG: tetratricopeptide repeat protein [Nitrospirota bacterium]|nr:tetratricopeptide repeat protein [Nitrospirota bacterium]